MTPVYQFTVIFGQSIREVPFITIVGGGGVAPGMWNFFLTKREEYKRFFLLTGGTQNFHIKDFLI